MNRRQYLSVFGTVGVSAAGLWFAYQVSEGNIDVGREADVTVVAERAPESAEFEAPEGADIFVTLTDTGSEPYRGAFTLQDPTGADVLDGRIGTSEMTSETHTAGRTGTYRLVVDPRGGSVRASVVQEPDAREAVK